MNRFSKAFITVALLALLGVFGVAEAETYPSCVEDKRVYTITAGEDTFGAISSATMQSCPAGEPSLLVVRDPATPALVIPVGGWTYLLSTNSEAAAELEFTVDAMCGSTIVCVATVQYRVVSGAGTGTEYPACSASADTVSYEAGGFYTGSFPLDARDAQCVYTSVVGQPSLGAVSVSDATPLQYLFTSSENMGNAFTSIPYEIRCNGVTQCKDEVSIALTPRTTTTSAAPQLTCKNSEPNRAYLAGMNYRDSLPFGLAKDPACTYTAVVEPPTVGIVSAVEGLSYAFSSPANVDTVSTVLSYSVYCGARLVCSDAINLYLQEIPATPNLPSCSERNSVRTYRPGTTYTDTIDYDASLTTCTGPLTTLMASPSVGYAYVFDNDPMQFLFFTDAGTTETRTALNYRVACNGRLVCRNTLSVLIEDAYPKCTASPAQQHYQPGITYTASVPHDAVDTSRCSRVTVTLEPPTVGSAAVVSDKFPFQYVFLAPADTTAASSALTYRVNCEGAAVCRDTVSISLETSAPACANAPTYRVAPLGQVGGVLATGTACDGKVTGSLTEATGKGDLVLSSGLSFTFSAPAAPATYTATVRALCDGAVLCDLPVTFETTLTPAETTTTTTLAPGQTTTTTTTTEAPLTLPDCEGKEFAYTVPTGRSMRGTLHVPLPAGQECAITTYAAVRTGALEGEFEVNIIGDFIYQAPHFQAVETAYVDVSCVTTPVCRATVLLTAYTDFQNSTTTTTTAAPLPTCANVYHFDVIPGAALSSSLNGKPGQDACVYGRYFSLKTPPQAGSIELMPIGDFLYTPPYEEGNYAMTFTMYCNSRVYCEGAAYFLVSNRHTFPPTTEDPSVTKPPAMITNPQITCRGTCNEKAWKTYPKPAMWDNTPGSGYARKDGNAVDGISVMWSKNTLVFKVYTLIGNLGVRFPTFEPINHRNGTYFESADVSRQIANTSAGFEASCLDGQGRIGISGDVWKWDWYGYGAGEGSVGALYDRGLSWYQKFGGKHIQCDTFADACRYAPLLTPANVSKPGSLGMWTVDIDDCDATWTGVFSYASLQQLRKADKVTPVWSLIGPHQIKGTLISEAVRAGSWIAPGAVDTRYNAHDVLINLDQFVLVSTLSENSHIAVDAEFFTYRDAETGDHAFGINMLVYPSVTAPMTTSYAADRHVAGFKWIAQNWVAPDDRQCPTCTGASMNCSASGLTASSTYTGDFPTGTCPGGTGRIHLVKGPSMTPDDCPSNAMHVYGRPGFSATRNCKATYQNITMRGILSGSAALSEGLVRALNYEGDIELQFLMDDNSKETMNLQLSMYVSRLTQDSKTATGGLTACRSGSYWPVLDPLGSSLPDAPFPLSTSAPASICVDYLSSSYGPSDWALFTLDLPGIAPSQVSVQSIYVLDGIGGRVYLYYKDPSTGTAALPPASIGTWWQNSHPYLAFRDLSTTHISNTTASAQFFRDATCAFIFIPGAVGYETNIEVVVEATTREADGEVGHSTFRRMLHVDPLLTQLSRQGPVVVEVKGDSAGVKSDLVAISVVAFVSVVLVATVVIFMVADNNRPLPKWVPRGKLIKQTVLSVLPPGMRGKKKEKRVVHKDMYDAMKSGKY